MNRDSFRYTQVGIGGCKKYFIFQAKIIKEVYTAGRLCTSYFKGTGSRDRSQIFKQKWILLGFNRDLYFVFELFR